MPSDFLRLTLTPVALPGRGLAGDGVGVRQFLAFIGLLFFAASAMAAVSNVSGAIAVNTRWTLADSPYIVSGDVVVQDGALLTVDPGVTVYMGANSSLTLQNGGIQALGTAVSPIRVLSDKTRQGQTAAPGDWRQWVFGPGTVNTRLDHVEFAHGSGLSVQGSAPVFNYLNLHHHQGAAIAVDLTASPTGVGNQATGNSLNGISVPAGDLLGSVTWGIKGIPYVVLSGTVSVGASPVISSISPSEVQQSQTIDAVISGTRLSGAESITFDAAGVSAILSGGGSDTAIPVRITASAGQALGNVPFTVMTAAGSARYASGISVIALKPTIAVGSITPGSLRRAETKNFQISGSSLLGAQVSVPAGAGLTLGNLQTTATQASFDLTASAMATLGAQTLSVSNPAVANGVATVQVSVAEALPKINTNTIPSAVAPDGVAHPFSLSLTNTDTVSHSLNLSTLDPTIISVSPAQVTIPAGSTSASITITGLKAGYTPLNITSPTLAAVSKQIFASTLVNGAVVGPVQSAPVGVNVPYSLSTLLPVGTAVPVTSAPVGVNVPYSLSTVLPVGTTVPVTSAPVGVDVPYNLSTLLPVGTTVLVTSAPVGVDVPYNLSTLLPVGTVVPVISVPVGVNVP